MPRQRRWLKAAWAGLIAAAVLVVFRGVWRNQFLEGWDDQMIYDNPHLGALTWANLKWMFTDASLHPRHVYMPLSWLWWCLVNRTLGLSPAVYHGINIALHALNAVLVFFLARRIVAAYSPRPARLPSIAPAAAALFWALHPLRVETVAWAITQKFLIATGLCLIATFFWLRWLEEGREGRPKSSSPCAAALVCFAASVLFYPVAPLFPVVLAVLALAAPGRTAARSLAAVAPFFLVAGLALIPPLLNAAGEAGPATTLLSRVEEPAYVWMYYLWKPFAPVSLTPIPTALVGFDPHSAVFVGSLIAFIAVTALALRWRRRAPWLLAAWLCHLVLLAPVAFGRGATVNMTSDRYSYIEGIVWAVMLVWILSRLPWPAWPGSVAKASAALALVLLAWSGRAAAAQNALWHDDGTFFQYLLRQPDSGDYRCSISTRLGDYYRSHGRLAEARTAYIAATRAAKVNPDLLLPIGNELESLHDPKDAAFAAALSAYIRPSVDTFAKVAAWSYEAGEYETAAAADRRALELKEDPDLRYDVAVALNAEGKPAEAMAACDDALRRNPANARARAFREKLLQGGR